MKTAAPRISALEAKILLMDIDAIPRDDSWDYKVWKTAVAKLTLIARLGPKA